MNECHIWESSNRDPLTLLTVSELTNCTKADLYTKVRKCTKVSNKDSAKDSSTAPTQSMVDTLQYTLGWAAQVLRCVVRNVRAAGSPYGSVRNP